MILECKSEIVLPGRQNLLGPASLVTLPLAAAIWSRGSMMAVGCAAAIGCVLAALGMLQPRWLQPLLALAGAATRLFVIIVHEAVLLFAFYLVFVPVGLLFRLIGRDALQLRIDRSTATYWQEKKCPGGPRSYFRRW